MSKTQIDGLADIERLLNNLPDGLGRGTLVRFGKKRLEPMRDAAKAGAPVDEGELREEIIISTRQRTGRKGRRRYQDRAEVEIAMGPSLHVQQKAVPQEFGSINNPPSGFMRKAWDQHHGQLLDNISEDLGSEVVKTADRLARRQAQRAKQG